MNKNYVESPRGRTGYESQIIQISGQYALGLLIGTNITLGTLRFRSTESSLPVAMISRLRQITGLSIADIRSRAANGQSLFEITAFQNDWQNRRHLLVQIARDIAAGTLPLTVAEVHSSQESPVPVEMLKNLIAHFRQIEIDTQTDTMLELGEISDRSEFVPYDEDWTDPQHSGNGADKTGNA